MFATATAAGEMADLPAKTNGDKTEQNVIINGLTSMLSIFGIQFFGVVKPF